MALDVSRKPRGFNAPSKAREYERLARELLSRAEQVCRMLLPGGRKDGHEWRVGSIQGERGKSMGVNLHTGVWKDFDGGEGGADLISLWAAKKGVSNHEAYDEAAEWMGWAVNKDTGETRTWWRNSAAPGAKPDAPAPVTTPPSEGDGQWWLKAKSTKRWDYFDGDGELWATVFRFERPGEKIIRPWDHKRNDWKWPEGLRPLFNLEHLKTTPGPVILVEGEKCADRLNDMGYTATTMPGGSNAAKVIDWRPLAGREILRWADNDHPIEGKRVAREIWNEATLKALEAIGARSVRDVSLPGAAKPDGWDCADADDAEISRLIEAGLSSAAVYEGAGPFSILDWDVATIYGGVAPEQLWLVDQTFPLGKAGLLAAQGDAGKSMLLLDLALTICSPPLAARGMDYRERVAFGHDVPVHGSVVLFLAEDDKGEVHRRLASLDSSGARRKAAAGKLYIVAFPDAGGAPYLVTGDERSVSATAEFEVLRQQLRSIKDLKLIGFDPLTPFVGGDLNKPHIGGAMSKMLAQLSAETGATVIMTHHLTKGERGKPISGPEEARIAIRGAAAIVDGLRFAYAMWQANENEARRVLEGLGRGNERNAMYRGAIVKANARADRDVLAYIRNESTGLLEVRTQGEIAAAKETPPVVTDAAARYLWALVKYRQERGQGTSFGKGFHLITKASAEEIKKARFVKPTDADLAAVLTLADMSRKPAWSEIAAAADATILGQGHPSIQWNGKDLEVVGPMP